MSIVQWILPIIFAFLMGITFVQYLTVHPLRMSLYLVIALVLLFGLILMFIFIIERRNALWISILSVLFFVTGYWVMTKRILSQSDPREIPKLTRTRSEKGDGHTAVVYFTHGEPETYNPIGWINQFREFDEQGIRFIPFLARPVFIYMLRNKYLQVGKSDHRKMHLQMMKRLEQSFRSDGDDSTKFYISFLDDDPRPDAAAIRALNEGAGNIIVSEVFLTISNHTAEGEDLIKALNIEENFGINVRYTGPLWNSQLLQQMFVMRVNKTRGSTPKEKVGILLVGHGQPDEWDVEWPTETEQEIRFREEVLKLFIEDGY
ncbi:hypothetical protein GF337_19785, partial [candidate division KSB1 bacterium]|nr:hypothetical protein [candidate division KSB1 bacterium]